MECYSESHSECAEPPPCAKGADCAAPADAGCTTVTVSACVPHYVPPCASDSECGPGFTCVEQEECACSGSTGSGGGSAPSAGSGGGTAGSGGATPSDSGNAPSDAGAADPIPTPDGGAEPPPDAKMAPDAGAPAPVAPPECTCTPSGVKACKLTVVGCNTASDCPSGFTCENNPSGSCWASSDGSSGCDTPDPAMICAPPYTDLLGGAHADDSGGELGVSEPTAGGGTPEAPKANDPTDGNSASAANAGGEDVVTHGGCAMASAPSESNIGYGLVALGFAGLIGARRRRR